MSETKQFLDKNGLNALWSKMCSTFIPNRPSTKFYPFIGTASRSKNYKITLPYNGVTASYKLYMMNTMEIVLGSSYQKGAAGKIFLSYYFTRDINGTWLANDLRAFAIGCNISPTITYQISNPAIFWISLNSTIYNVISIKNLTAEDSAPSYDYRNTTIEAVADVPTTNVSSVPITILSSDDNKLKYNGNEIAVVNHTHSYLPLSGGTLTGPLTISDNSLNITNEKPVVFTIPRCNEDGGGWAVKQLIVNGHEDSGGNYPTIYSMGSYGQNNALNYIFIGANEYSSTKNLRIYPNGNVEAPTFTGNLTGNAAVASKLGSSTIGNSLTPIYISSGSPKQCSALADTLITYESVYNDYDAAAKLSPIQLSASNYHSANRLAFANPDGITIEYSTDGGTTWVDYGLSNNDKFRFITHADGIYIYAGKKLSAKASKNDKLRITLHASNLGLYTRATNLLVNMSTNGSVCNKSNGGVDNCIKVDIERSNIGSESNFTSTASNIRLAGWSGWNNIPMNQISFGGGSTQTSNIGAIRLTFYSDGAGSSYSSGAHFYIQNLYLIGSTYWASPSTLAKTGHLYDYNYLQDMILPKDLVPRTHNTGQIGWGDKQWAAIYANGFYENGTQLVNKYAAKEHTHTKSGEGKIWLYPENGNEVNFGGTSTDSAVYFGYRTKDSKPIPTLFIFGSSTGTSQIKAAGFIKKDSSNSYVLLGGGGHKAISDFATASKLGSSTIGATDRPIYLSGGSPVQTTYRMAGTNEVATTAIDISSAINTGIWYVNGTSNIYSQADGVAIVNRYNDSWISQIYQDYRTGKLAVRGKNNGVWTEWKKIALTSDIPTSLPWSSITSKPTFATVATTGSYNDLTNKPTIPAAVTVDTSLSSTSTNPVQNKVINDALGNKADKSETLLGYNLQERIEDLNLGTTNRFFRTGGSPDNAPGQNGYVVGLTMALNNDSDYRVQLAYDQSISRLSYRQQSGATIGWGDWKKIALLTDIPTIGNGTITIKQNGTSKGTFTVNQTGNTTIELTDTTGITSQDHYKTSVAAGTAGTSSATSGSTLAVPYVTVNANGHVTGYGTHTHTISGFLTSHQSIYNLTMQAGAFSAAKFDPNGADKTVNIPTKTSHLTNDSGFVDNKIKTPAITSFAMWDGITKFGLRAWSNNATSRPSDYGIALDFAGDNGGYNWRNRLAFATEGKGIHYYYATNNTILNYGGRLITTKGDYTLNGNLTANAYYISSDERLKTFGDDIKVDFDELAKLRKSHFVFNDNPTKQEIGVSAQEVQKIYPEIVNETEEGTLSVDYSKLAVVALAAIDKLNQRVQELENKLAKYE